MRIFSSLAGRLIAREAAAAPNAAAAAYAAWQRAHALLARWLGPVGTEALFARALAQAQAEHPSLRSLHVTLGSDPGLDGLPEGIHTHGSDPVAAGLEAALANLFEILGRLIGEDMTMRLVDPDGPSQASHADGQR